jgi:hypothetical protein
MAAWSDLVDLSSPLLYASSLLFLLNSSSQRIGLEGGLTDLKNEILVFE